MWGTYSASDRPQDELEISGSHTITVSAVHRCRSCLRLLPAKCSAFAGRHSSSFPGSQGLEGEKAQWCGKRYNIIRFGSAWACLTSICKLKHLTQKGIFVLPRFLFPWFAWCNYPKINMPWAELCKHKTMKNAANIFFLEVVSKSSSTYSPCSAPHLYSAFTLPETSWVVLCHLDCTHRHIQIYLQWIQNITASYFESPSSSVLICKQEQDRFGHSHKNMWMEMFIFKCTWSFFFDKAVPEGPFWSHSLKAWQPQQPQLCSILPLETRQKSDLELIMPFPFVPQPPAGCWIEILHLARLIYKHYVFPLPEVLFSPDLLETYIVCVQASTYLYIKNVLILSSLILNIVHLFPKWSTI